MSQKPLTSYVAALTEVIKTRDDEIRRARDRGARAVDPCGSVATEVLAAVRAGAANHERILDAVDVDSAALHFYLAALKKAGLVRGWKKLDARGRAVTRWRATDVGLDAAIDDDAEAAADAEEEAA